MYRSATGYLWSEHLNRAKQALVDAQYEMRDVGNERDRLLDALQAFPIGGTTADYMEFYATHALPALKAAGRIKEKPE